MTNADFVQVIAFIEVACGKPIYTPLAGETATETAQKADYRIRVYFDLLGDLDRDVFLAAAKRVALERQWPTFPTVAELRRAATETTQGLALTAGEAWGKVSKVLANIDPEIAHSPGAGKDHLANVRCPCAGCKLQELPPEVRRVVESFGLASMLARETPVSVIRAQFERAFTDRQEAEFRNALLPPAVRQQIEQVGRRTIAQVVAEIGKE